MIMWVMKTLNNQMKQWGKWENSDRLGTTAKLEGQTE